MARHDTVNVEDGGSNPSIPAFLVTYLRIEQLIFENDEHPSLSLERIYLLDKKTIRYLYFHFQLRFHLLFPLYRYHSQRLCVAYYGHRYMLGMTLLYD